MAGKYKGPERRSKGPTRRVGNFPVGDTIHTYERRLEDRMSGRPRVPVIADEVVQGRGFEGSHYGIVETKTKNVRPERRMGGAGRRKGDMSRALKTGEPVIFQVGKGAWANAGKLAKKIISKKLKLGP
jgi:hypothetical protein